jgi:hypothetical protein
MSVSELGSALVTPFDPRRRAPDRRTPREPPPRREPESAAASLGPAPSPSAQDPAFLAPVFRPDLSQLATLGEARLPSSASPPSDPEVYAHFDKLVAAIRAGDLVLARAVVEALETEMLVERSAGRASRWLGDDVRTAPARRPAPPRHAVDAVYETLAHYLVTDGLTS